MRLLLVEDSADLARTVAQALREDGYLVDLAGDGQTGLHKALGESYDLIILDLMLPGRDGLSVLAEFRRTHDTPVLILTARDGVTDRVRGLDQGGDDYLTKPFALEELLARVRALVRRSSGQASPVLAVGDLELDLNRRTAAKGGQPIALTQKEYALLELLALRRGKLVTRTEIYEKIYDEADDTLSNVVDVYVSNLRKKLGADFIVTRRGQGYLIDV
jgi:two-component system OmpR family response regulator